MWAKRYINIAKEKGTPAARKWVTELIPADAVQDVKKIVENILGIKRG